MNCKQQAFVFIYFYHTKTTSNSIANNQTMEIYNENGSLAAFKTSYSQPVSSCQYKDKQPTRSRDTEKYCLPSTYFQRSNCNGKLQRKIILLQMTLCDILILIGLQLSWTILQVLSLRTTKLQITVTNNITANNVAVRIRCGQHYCNNLTANLYCKSLFRIIT